MPEAVNKKIRDIEIVDDAKLRRKKIYLQIISAILFFLPIWIWRFYNFGSLKYQIKKHGQVWNNSAWRERETGKLFRWPPKFGAIHGFIGVAASCWLFCLIWLMLIFQSSAPSAYWQFFLTLALSDVILNPFSKRWMRPDFSALMLTPKRIPLNLAPDVDKTSYPIGWSPQFGWIRHGYRATGMPVEVFPRHLVVFGEYGQGQWEMALNCIMRAFEILKNVVVLILDADAGGLNFSAFKDVRGIVLFDTQPDCERALWYVSQEIKRRKKYLEVTAPNILLIADMKIAAGLIGRNSELSHLTVALNEVVTEGRNFGVNVVAFPPAEYFYQRITEDYRHHFDRLQYFTKAKYKIKQGGAGEMVEKNVESPHAAIDMFLFDVMGKAMEFKAVAPKLGQVLNRIKSQTLPPPAVAFYQKLSFFDVSEFAPMPRRDDTLIKLDPRKKKIYARFEKWYTQKKKNKIHIGAPKYEYMPQPNGENANSKEV